MNSLLVSVGILISSFSNKHLELYLQTRSEEGELDGLDEFPGGKLELGESPVNCLIREINEEIGIDVSETRKKQFQTITHTYPDRKVTIHFYIIDAKDISLSYTRIGFDNYHQFLHKIPCANREVMENLKEYLCSKNSEFLWK
jgi:mutator protein MutT